jgi:hypothetical protein
LTFRPAVFDRHILAFVSAPTTQAAGRKYCHQGREPIPFQAWTVAWLVSMIVVAVVVAAVLSFVY